MKTALFGGTFNPVHIGHLIIANYCAEELSIDRIIFIPATLSPFKTNSLEILNADTRKELLEIAVADNEKFSVDEYEINKGGVSYSYETIQYFKNKFPDDDLSLLIGGDQIISFHKWKNFEYIMDNVNLIVAKRPNTFNKNEIEIINNHLNSKNRIIWLDSPLLEISSTEIRDLIRAGKSIKYLVTRECEQYIIDKKLFRL